MLSSIPISLVIPTYRRDDILIATIRHLLRLNPKPAEILPWGHHNWRTIATRERRLAKLVSDSAHVEIGKFCYLGARTELDISHPISIGDW
jgi:hypothetical protein